MLPISWSFQVRKGLDWKGVQRENHDDYAEYNHFHDGHHSRHHHSHHHYHDSYRTAKLGNGACYTCMSRVCAQCLLVTSWQSGKRGGGAHTDKACALEQSARHSTALGHTQAILSSGNMEFKADPRKANKCPGVSRGPPLRLQSGAALSACPRVLSLRMVLLSGMWTWGYDSQVGAYCYRRIAKGNGWRTADVLVPYDVRGVTVRMHYHQYQCVDPRTRPHPLTTLTRTPYTTVYTWHTRERTSSCVCTCLVRQMRSR